MDAGKMETVEYKNMEAQQRELIKRYHEVATGTDKASESSKLFRKHSINLGADLVILSYGVRQTYRDISDLTKMVKKGNIDWLEFSGTVATATISLVAMTPALKAIASAFPVLTGALTTFGLVVANIAAQIAMLVKVIKDIPVAIDSISDIFAGRNVFDLWIEKTNILTYGLIDLRNKVEDLKLSLYDLGGSKWNAYGQYLSNEVLVGPPEKTVDDNRLTQWRKSLEDKPIKTGTSKTLQETKEEAVKWSVDISTIVSQTLYDNTLNILSGLKPIPLPVGFEPSGMDVTASEDAWAQYWEDFYAGIASQEEINQAMTDAFTQSLDIASQISTIFGGAADEIINAFRTAYSLANSIASFISSIISIISMFTPAGVVGAAVGAVSRAGGGDVVAGTLYRVNENETEYFKSNVSGTIIPLMANQGSQNIQIEPVNVSIKGEDIAIVFGRVEGKKNNYVSKAYAG